MILEILFNLIVFPGLLFQTLCGFLFEWLDRKMLARYQRRIGPRIFQPVADLLKLFSKENILPKGSNHTIAAALPLISLASVTTAGIYIPVAGFSPQSFAGDLIVVMFLMSVPTLAYYLSGVVSVGIYSLLGGGRSLLQFFSYEVPLIIALSGPAILANSWTILEILQAQKELGSFVVFQPIGFGLAVIGLIGKLKRDPLDIPKAKSEVVAGALTEYTGPNLAFWRLVMNVQAVLGIFLLINLFFGQISNITLLRVIIFIAVALVITILLSTLSAIFARLRIDQLAEVGWRVLVPIGLLQLVFVVLLRF